MGHERLSENVCWNIILTGVSGKYQSLVIIKEANTHRQPPLITLAWLHPLLLFLISEECRRFWMLGEGEAGGGFPWKFTSQMSPPLRTRPVFQNPSSSTAMECQKECLTLWIGFFTCSAVSNTPPRPTHCCTNQEEIAACPTTFEMSFSAYKLS